MTSREALDENADLDRLAAARRTIWEAFARDAGIFWNETLLALVASPEHEMLLRQGYGFFRERPSSLCDIRARSVARGTRGGAERIFVVAGRADATMLALDYRESDDRPRIVLIDEDRVLRVLVSFEFYAGYLLERDACVVAPDMARAGASIEPFRARCAALAAHSPMRTIHVREDDEPEDAPDGIEALVRFWSTRPSLLGRIVEPDRRLPLPDAIRIGDRVSLERDTSRREDPFAVRVRIFGITIGHLAADQSVHVAGALDSGIVEPHASVECLDAGRIVVRIARRDEFAWAVPARGEATIADPQREIDLVRAIAAAKRGREEAKKKAIFVRSTMASRPVDPRTDLAHDHPTASLEPAPSAPGPIVGIEYVDAEGRRTRRVIEVLRALTTREGRFYAIEGYCKLRNAVRLFRADRIESAFIPETGEVAHDVLSLVPAPYVTASGPF